MSARLAQVVRVNHTRRTVDLEYLDTREPVREAIVLGDASSVAGSWKVPDMPRPATPNQDGELVPTGRTMVAMVVQCGRKPTVIGFVPSEGDQVRFNTGDLFVDRHPSGVIHSTEPDGSMQTLHPGGATFRLGTPAVLDLSTVAADGNWNLPAGAPPTLTVLLPGANLVVTPGGGVTLNITGPVVVNAPAGTTWTGDIALEGTLTATQDVLAAGISLVKHEHTSAGSGSPTSGPIPGT